MHTKDIYIMARIHWLKKKLCYPHGKININFQLVNRDEI